MRLSTNDDNEIVVEELYEGFTLRTAEGNEYGICMRDDTIEIIIRGETPSPRVYNIKGDHLYVLLG